MSDLDALLAAVIAAPDDDTPRLVYADELDAHAGAPTRCVKCPPATPGRIWTGMDGMKWIPCSGCRDGWVPDALAARAEFVRVQCKLAGEFGGPAKGCPFPVTTIVTTYGGLPPMPPTAEPCSAYPIGGGGCERCLERIALERREDDLFYASKNGAVGWHPPGWDVYRRSGPAEHFARPAVVLARGFVEWVKCPAADWLAHADAILAEHPVRTVLLTTWPGALCNESSGWKLYDGVDYTRLRPGRFLPDFPPNGLRAREAIAEMLRLEWPGVAFELPPFDELLAHAADLYPEAAASFRAFVDEQNATAPPSPPA